MFNNKVTIGTDSWVASDEKQQIYTWSDALE